MLLFLFFFFFNDTATTEIYTLSLHDALPISAPALIRDVKTGVDKLGSQIPAAPDPIQDYVQPDTQIEPSVAVKDRKSTRLNSSHSQISYAVFCLKKKKEVIAIY